MPLLSMTYAPGTRSLARLVRGSLCLLFLAVLYAPQLPRSVAQTEPTPTPPAPRSGPTTLYLPLILGSGTNSTPAGATATGCLSPQEAELARLINEYRQANGLAPIPVSRSLTLVAQWHVIDLSEHNPASGTDSRGMTCNLHSWSNQGQGRWNPVCYTNDHAYKEGMWQKPSEVTGGVYTGYGFENAFWSSNAAQAETVFNAWKNQPTHNSLMINLGTWQNSNWQSLGVGIYNNYAVAWFGRDADPQGTAGTCQ